MKRDSCCRAGRTKEKGALTAIWLSEPDFAGVLRLDAPALVVAQYRLIKENE